MTTESATESFTEALVVGTGFAGLYQVHLLRKMGIPARVLERGGGVGGTWYWNRYPGARCDAPSMFYSVSYLPDLDQEWTWPEVFSAQEDIRQYIEAIVDQQDLRRDITFNTELTDAAWDSARSQWVVSTSTGETIRCTYLIMATGSLSAPRLPSVPGLETFRGRWFHTGRWPQEEVAFTGRRVGVIGTGSTAVQVIPVVAERAAHLTVIQRTPKFVLPSYNRPLTEDDIAPIKANYPALRQAARRGDYGMPYPSLEVVLTDLPPDEQETVLEAMWQRGGFGGFVSSYKEHLGLKNQAVNDIVADFARRKIRQAVTDPEVAEILTPYGYPIGINRIILGTNFYETFNRDNVSVHDARSDAVVAITPDGVQTEKQLLGFDDLIFATGYDGLTGALTAVRITGSHGKTIAEEWRGGPHTYLGQQVAQFPNLFTITGPGSPSVLANVITTIEQHVEFVTGLIAHARAQHQPVIEADPLAEKEWTGHVADVAEGTLFRYAYKANAWYTGANVPGKKVVFMPYAGGVGKFEEVLQEVAADEYRGFVFSAA